MAHTCVHGVYFIISQMQEWLHGQLFCSGTVLMVQVLQSDKARDKHSADIVTFSLLDLTNVVSACSSPDPAFQKHRSSQMGWQPFMMSCSSSPFQSKINIRHSDKEGEGAKSMIENMKEKWEWNGGKRSAEDMKHEEQGASKVEKEGEGSDPS